MVAENIAVYFEKIPKYFFQYYGTPDICMNTFRTNTVCTRLAACQCERQIIRIRSGGLSEKEGKPKASNKAIWSRLSGGDIRYRTELCHSSVVIKLLKTQESTFPSEAKQAGYATEIQPEAELGRTR